MYLALTELHTGRDGGADMCNSPIPEMRNRDKDFRDRGKMQRSGLRAWSILRGP